MLVSLVNAPSTDGYVEFRPESLKTITMGDLHSHYGRFDIAFVFEIWDNTFSDLESIVVCRDVFGLRPLRCCCKSLPDSMWKKFLVSEYVNIFYDIGRQHYDHYVRELHESVEKFCPEIHKWEYRNRIEFMSHPTLTRVCVMPYLPTTNNSWQDFFSDEEITSSCTKSRNFTNYILKLNSPVHISFL